MSLAERPPFSTETRDDPKGAAAGALARQKRMLVDDARP
jgi:hypothetical protein